MKGNTESRNNSLQVTPQASGRGSGENLSLKYWPRDFVCEVVEKPGVTEIRMVAELHRGSWVPRAGRSWPHSRCVPAGSGE